MTFLSLSAAFAGRDDHEFVDIDTCYHWIQPDQLASKIQWSKAHNGQMYFYNRNVVYCWRSPLGAQSAWEDHGDELVRIKFKPGTKLINRTRVASFDQIDALGAQGIYSNDNAWQEYTISPAAVESWSIYQPNTILEMKAELAFYQKGEARPADVFYPFQYYDKNWINTMIPMIIADQEAKSLRQPQIFGDNIQNHFKTNVTLPWMKYLNRLAFTPVKELQTIKIAKATYGLNLSAGYDGNATEKAAAFCDDKAFCSYKVSKRYLDDPSPGQDKDFKIEWTCGKNKKVQSKTIASPAEDKTFEINCNA